MGSSTFWNALKVKHVYLLSAILLSIAAAFMSVVGLNKIFPTIIYPFVILEAVKFVAAIYMHNNWKQMGIAMKSYMLAGITVLMLMTSAGIYGYLANAAMAHTTATVQELSQATFLQDKVSTLEQQRQEAVAAKVRLDKVVDGYASLNDPNAAVRSATVFSRQKDQRNNLDANIAKIDEQLRQVKADLIAKNSSVAAVRNEIGPGVYLANVLYGDSSMENIEAAIQIVILLIVFTFDPMAVVMMINASKQYGTVELVNPIHEVKTLTQQEIPPEKEEAVDAVKVHEVIAEPATKPKRKYVRKQKVPNAITTDPHANVPVVEPINLQFIPLEIDEPNQEHAGHDRVESIIPEVIAEVPSRETVRKKRNATRLKKRKGLIEDAITRVEL